MTDRRWIDEILARLANPADATGVHQRDQTVQWTKDLLGRLGLDVTNPRELRAAYIGMAYLHQQQRRALAYGTPPGTVQLLTAGWMTAAGWLAKDALQL